VSPYGLHWPDLDEDLSSRGLLEGDYGQNKACQPTSAGDGPKRAALDPRRSLIDKTEPGKDLLERFEKITKVGSLRDGSSASQIIA
jgi:hypothetical protein